MPPTVAALDHIHALSRFVSASPSSVHAAAEMVREFGENGFRVLDEAEAWPTGTGRYLTVRDGAVIAWVVPRNAGPATPFHVVGTHTDSPGFMLKPKPTIRTEGWWQAGVEVYGGPQLVSWLDRELELAGRLVTRDGREHLVRTGPLLRIPHLAIHLDRSANDSMTLDKQRHTQPVWGLDEVSGPASQADLLAVLAEAAAVPADDIGGYDLRTADTAEPRIFGAGNALFASGRLDNLLSTHAATVALNAAAESAERAGHISVLAAFDYEEIGSQTRSGACGPFLADVLDRIGSGLGATSEEKHRAFARSIVVSSDVGHCVHPNYPERHDPVNHPVAGGGPILKINANQRYTTDAHGAAFWASACEAAGVPSQEFVSNNSVACGSTTGPLTATRLGIRTVDVGVGILSMHSARELTAVPDPHYLSLAMQQVFAGE